MRRYLIAWALLFIATLGGWYLVGTLELGVVDGTGVAPAWLRVAYAVELLLLFPLGRLALALDPAIGYFSLEGFLLFTVIVATNSALLIGLVWLVCRHVRRERGKEQPASRTEP